MRSTAAVSWLDSTVAPGPLCRSRSPCEVADAEHHVVERGDGAIAGRAVIDQGLAHRLVRTAAQLQQFEALTVGVGAEDGRSTDVVVRGERGPVDVATRVRHGACRGLDPVDAEREVVVPGLAEHLGHRAARRRAHDLQLDHRAVVAQEVRDHLRIVEAGLAERRRVGDHEQRVVPEAEHVAVADERTVEIGHTDGDVRERDDSGHGSPSGRRAILPVVRARGAGAATRARLPGDLDGLRAAERERGAPLERVARRAQPREPVEERADAHADLGAGERGAEAVVRAEREREVWVSSRVRSSRSGSGKRSGSRFTAPMKMQTMSCCGMSTPPTYVPSSATRWFICTDAS